MATRKKQPLAAAPAQERRSAAASRRKSPGKPRRTPVEPQQVTQQPQHPLGRAKGDDQLTDQQRQFARAYTVHRNATQAALDAGYSKATASSQGSRLLSKGAVRALIQQVHVEVEAKAAIDLGITVERTLLELRRLAFFDIRRLYAEDGSLIPLHKLDDDTAAALTGIEVQELYGGSGEDRQAIGLVRKWKAASKDKALDMLMKHQNLYKADNEGKASTLAEQLAAFVGQIHSSGGSQLPIRQPEARK